VAVGQGYAYHPGIGWSKIQDGNFWADHAAHGMVPVKEAWAFHAGHGWRQWYPHAGGSVPPGGGTPPGSGHTYKTVTLAGHRSGSTGGTWLFQTGSYKGKITRAALVVTVGHGTHAAGTATGYPSGGTLAHIDQNHDTTRSYSVSADAFNGATRGVTIHTIGSIPTKVSLRITYRVT